jgi:CRP/FNR family cyclic AMP-dependent transcriptional regulator
MPLDDIFGELDYEDRVRLLESANPKTFQPGKVIIRQGHELKQIFVILDGEVVVEQTNPTGTETMELARLGVGNVFGEMSFLSGERTSATVRTMTEVDVLCLPHRNLRKYLKDDPLFSAQFYKSMAVTLAVRLKVANELHYQLTEV